MSKEASKFELPKTIDRHLAALSKLYEQEGKRQLQEIIVNAQTHIHEEWSTDNWNGGTYRRGIIEAWGRGTIRMGELTVRAGLASPEILEAGGCVTVRFSPTRYVPPQRVAQNVTERQQRVLAVLSTSAEGMALRDIRKGLGEEIAEWEIKNELAALKHLGLVQTKGYARGARWILS